MMIGTLPAEPFNSVTNHKITFELNLEMQLFTIVNISLTGFVVAFPCIN